MDVSLLFPNSPIKTKLFQQSFEVRSVQTKQEQHGPINATKTWNASFEINNKDSINLQVNSNGEVE